MEVKVDKRAARKPRCASVESPGAAGDTGTERFGPEQLAKQAGRILEQLIVLDEQYREVIVKHDRSALEALSACTVALSKLARVRDRASSPRVDSGLNGRSTKDAVMFVVEKTLSDDGRTD
jgi:hypothetical protein